MRTLKEKNIGQFDPPLQFFNSFSLLLIIVNHLSFLKIEQRLPIPVKLNPTKMRAIVLFSQGSDNHSLAWVLGVAGEKGKDGSNKGRELKERNACTDAFTGAFHPHTAWFDTIQSKSLPVIGLSTSKSSPKINLTLLSGRPPVLVLLRFRFLLKPPMRSFRILAMENLPFLRSYNMF